MRGCVSEGGHLTVPAAKATVCKMVVWIFATSVEMTFNIFETLQDLFRAVNRTLLSRHKSSAKILRLRLELRPQGAE